MKPEDQIRSALSLVRYNHGGYLSRNVMGANEKAFASLDTLIAQRDGLVEALKEITGTSQATVGNPITVMRNIARNALQTAGKTECRG
jgi:hypothetical protein